MQGTDGTVRDETRPEWDGSRDETPRVVHVNVSWRQFWTFVCMGKSMSSRFPLFHRASILLGIREEHCRVASLVKRKIKAALHSSEHDSRLPCAKRGGGAGRIVFVCVFFFLSGQPKLSFNGPNSGHWAPAAPCQLAPSGIHSQSTRAGRSGFGPLSGDLRIHQAKN